MPTILNAGENLIMDIVNSNDIEELIKKDIIFRFILESYGPPPNWKRPNNFRSLCKIILEQQVSLKSAQAHFTKLEKYIYNFTPENVLRLSDEEMRNCQISRQKTQYLRSLAQSVLYQGLKMSEFPKLNEKKIRHKLLAIKGIGNWTVDVYSLLCLQLKDIFPIGDIAVIKAVQELTNAKKKEEILSLSEKWAPYRSLAVFFLWHYYLSKRKKAFYYD